MVWRCEASTYQPLRFSHGVDSKHMSDKNCYRVNNVSAKASCGKWLISACSRHYDAVPYLTMLLFSKSSAAVWLAGEREGTAWEGRWNGESNIWTGRDTKTGWWREWVIQSARDHWDGLVAISVSECMQQRMGSGPYSWSASHCQSITKSFLCSFPPSSFCTLQENCQDNCEERKTANTATCGQLFLSHEKVNRLFRQLWGQGNCQSVSKLPIDLLDTLY